MIYSRKTSLLLILLLLPCFMQAQVLKGKITDSSGHPLSYASVYLKEIKLGTATNQDGEYELRLPPGTFSVSYQYLGYMPAMERITMAGTDVVRDIILTEQVFMIPEVRISASGKDPAWYIMRKAIGMAPFHLNQIRKYKAEVYIKGGGKIDKLPKMIQKQMKIEANEESIKEGQYYFTESENMITFTAPDRYIHQVISSRTNVPSLESQASPMDYIEASFYQPVLADIAISPLAPNAFAHYDFKFLGASLQGEYLIDKVQVTPKRKSQQLFEGIIYIVEDQWAIHSLDLSNENMAGTIRIRQLYTPVEAGIWMPVSHEFFMNISIIGIKATASYSSSIKYLEVEPDRSLSPPAGYLITEAEEPARAIKSETEKEIEEIFAKSELTSRDMAKLAKLNEKNASKREYKDSLEIKEKTTYIINEDATKKDSAYWEQTRPIPLTPDEVESLRVLPIRPAAELSRRDTTTLTITVGNKPQPEKKSKAALAAKALVSGKNWNPSKNTTIGFDGLVNLRSFSFNTVDGFVLGTGFSLRTKAGDKGKFSFYPSARYAFNRKALMWNASVNLFYNPMTSGNFYANVSSGSRDFAQSGVNPFVNTISSLFFRQNWMKLYNSFDVTIGHRGDIANGLNLNTWFQWEKREVLDNSTSFSFLKPDREYSDNIPDNPFIAGEVSGYKIFTPINHNNASVNIELTYTPRNHYRIIKGAKINAGSDYPTFRIAWTHGFNYNDTLADHFDLLRADIFKTTRYAALNEFTWRLSGGGFINRKNLQIQDQYFFNTQESPVLINNYQDAFFLKNYYSISAPSYFAEAHLCYITPFLLLKRIPGLSKTLMRENLSLSSLWTPDYGFYTEFGYSVSEILLLGKLGVYTGFHNLSFDGIGLRLTLRLR